MKPAPAESSTPPNRSPSDDAEMERRVMKKATWRLIPFMCLCYLVAFIDRTNVAVAKLQMSFSDEVFGLGFGIFFLGYFLFEVPSNIILEKVGARIWIARIMIVWGFISSAMMFVGESKGLFYTLRFLLGAGEAGFFPGMILYLTYWFPSAYRARTVALFMTAAALSAFVGNPLSGALLKLNGLGGLAGYQWLFLLEGIPAVILGIVVLWHLPNRPRDAKWLTREETGWLERRLDNERVERERSHRMTLWQALTNGRVMLLSLLYFLLVIGGYGMDSFIPTLVKATTGWKDDFQVSLLSSLPALCAAIAMVFFGRHADRAPQPRGHVQAASLAAAAGLAVAALFGHPALVLLGLCLANSGRWSAIATFWALPTAFLSGTAAAGGIALINSIGNLGGFVGPYVVGFLKQHTAGYSAGLLVLAACSLLGAILPLAFRRDRGGTP